MRRKLLVTTLFTGLLAVSGCVQPPGTMQTGAQTGITMGGTPRADINPNNQLGALNLPPKAIPTLQAMEDIQRINTLNTGSTAADRLRGPAMRDAALSYGAIGGLAWGSQQINEMLANDSTDLSRIYDFNRLLIRTDGGESILPPVISESQDTYEQSDGGKTLRVADKYYQILEQARFSPVAPLWHTYLIRSFSVPQRPNDELLPKTAGERDLWRAYVAQGWEKGLEQAKATFKYDLARLNRDYTGMIRYKVLLDKHMVSAPVVANQNLGVTGNGENMRQGDRLYRITADPRLNVDHPSNYHASPSSLTPTEAATPPGSPVGEIGK